MPHMYLEYLHPSPLRIFLYELNINYQKYKLKFLSRSKEVEVVLPNAYIAGSFAHSINVFFVAQCCIWRVFVTMLKSVYFAFLAVC